MEVQEFREFAKAAVDFVADYLENIRDRNVIPDVQPGYLQDLLPLEAPEKPEPWKQILEDVNKKILPGCTHWASPNFHAYFPSGSSYPSLVGEIISIGLVQIGFNWFASPVSTELEAIVMNWMGRMLGLPEEFLNSPNSKGGGVIQGSASEAELICLLACRERTVKRHNPTNCKSKASTIRTKLVAYSSDQGNICIEKSGLLAAVKMRLLETNENCELEGITLEKAVKEDLENGLIPCFVVCTIGTTGTCAVDKIDEIGKVCKKYELWLHIDAAYAGTALACPEYRHLLKGIEYAHSFNFNPHKWMLINFDCSALWIRNSSDLSSAFNLNAVYLKEEHEQRTPEYRHWELGLGHRFRSLKVWFVLRTYGISGIQKHVRNHVELAEYFSTLVSNDKRFEVVTKNLGLVCFSFIDENHTKCLLEKLTERKRLFCIPYSMKGKYVIRFSINSRIANKSDIDFAWSEILYNSHNVVSYISSHQVSGKADVMSDNAKSNNKDYYTKYVGTL